MFNFFKKKNKGLEVVAVVDGDIMPITDVKDDVFSTKMLGDGFAIDIIDGKIVSPISGKLETVVSSGHAFGIKGTNGEVLIHVGIDTVELGGKYFTPKKKQGDTIKANEVILEFDIEAIKNEGYDVITPIIITNSDNYMDIILENERKIIKNENIMTVI